MLKRPLAYSTFVGLVVIGLSLQSCSSSRLAEQDVPHQFQYSNWNGNPEIVQLKPRDCSWVKSYVARHPHREKVYGPRYAEKENRQIIHVLD